MSHINHMDIPPMRPSNVSPFAEIGPRLIERGFAAIPIQPGAKCPGSFRAGEWRPMFDWSQYARRLPTDHEVTHWSRWPDAGIGVLCGPGSHDLAGGDIDTDDAAIKAALLAVLPPTTVRKSGAKGETLFYRWPGVTVLPKPSSWNINGKRVFDLIGPGRQTVLPPTLHPATGQPYRWSGSDALDDVNPADLPELPADICERISAALAPFGYQETQPEQPPSSQAGSVDDDSPFRALNQEALTRLKDWMPHLGLHNLKRRGQGYAAVADWRASSSGRPLEMRKPNLSVQPQGIRDFGDNKGYTPLDLVIAARGDGFDQAHAWLARTLGKLPDQPIKLEARLADGAKHEAAAGETIEPVQARAREPGDGTEHQDGWIGPNGEPPKGEPGHGATNPVAAPACAKQELPQIKATPFVWRDPSKIPPREWLYGGHVGRKYVSATVAPGGVGKSSLIIVEALAMVTGRDLIGHKPHDRLRVWYLNLEDPREELERRIAAACLHYGISPDEIEGRLFVDSGREVGMKIAVEDRNGVEIAWPVVAAVERAILDNRIDYMIVDPFVSSHAVNENDNMKIDMVAKMWGAIADRTNSATELLHHTRKGAHGQSEHRVEDGRGAGALVDAVRSARVLNVMSKEEASKFGVKQRRLYFRIDNGKANLAPPAEKSDWHHMVSVDIGNATADRSSDMVGVATRWTPPNPFDDVTTGHLDQVMKLVSEGDYRESVQSPAWVGKVVAKVLGLALDDPTATAKVKSLLKTWIAAGALKKVEKPDAKRVNRTFITAGEVIKIGLAPP